MTHRRFSGDELVLASHNDGKLREIATLFESYPFKVSSAKTYDLPEPEETETTFTGNAVLKARATAVALDKPALADDSGLVVPALNGDPGIYSARWAGPTKDFGLAMQKVHTSLEAAATPNWGAYFICALALVWPDGHEEVFEGRIDGNLVWPPRGHNGFGYDPIFVADGYDITFGQMDPQDKLAIGHRARAFAQLVQSCF